MGLVALSSSTPGRTRQDEKQQKGSRKTLAPLGGQHSRSVVDEGVEAGRWGRWVGVARVNV